MRLGLAVCVGAVSVALSTSAMATVIDFDGGVASTTSYTVSGVTFTASGQQLYTATSPNGTAALLAGSNPFYPITATLSSPTNFVSVDLGDYDSDPDNIFLEAYDASNNLLGSTSLLLDASDSAMHTLSLSFANIAWARFGST